MAERRPGVFEEILKLDAMEILGQQRALFRGNPQNVPTARKYFRMLFEYLSDRIITPDFYGEHIRLIRKLALESGAITLKPCPDNPDMFAVTFPLLMSHCDETFTSHEAAVQYIEYVTCLKPPPFEDECPPPGCGFGR